MIQYGRSIRWFSEYESEVKFSKENGFDFLQIWYRKGNIILDKVSEPKEKIIKENEFPVIFHALFDINEFEEYIPRLIEILKYLSHKEVIIHPICESEDINEQSIYKLCEKVAYASRELGREGIRLVLENNSRLDPIHYKAEEISIMFSQNTEIELLLDIAHIDSYTHLKEIVKAKKPSILHIADKHFNAIHEHLPVGKGEIDYKMVFKEVLNDFDGKIIFEVVDEDDAIINSKRIIEKIIEPTA